MRQGAKQAGSLTRGQEGLEHIPSSTNTTDDGLSPRLRGGKKELIHIFAHAFV